MKTKKTVRIIMNIIVIILLAAADQYFKYLAVLHLKDQAPYVLIDGILELHYLENRGAAFSMLQNKRTLFIFTSVVMLTIIFYVLFKLPRQKKYRIWQVFLCLICAGAAGNMIDRIRYDYVVDYIYFKIIDFPVFNLADILITIGTALFFIVVMFFVKEDELQFLRLNIRKEK